jgi:hypothetical protein
MVNLAQTRLVVQVYGLEYLMYNNSGRYDAIREIIKRQQEDANSCRVMDDSIISQIMPSVSDFTPSFFYQIFPTSKIVVSH